MGNPARYASTQPRKGAAVLTPVLTCIASRSERAVSATSRSFVSSARSARA
jgi:hypothetical protein